MGGIDEIAGIGGMSGIGGIGGTAVMGLSGPPSEPLMKATVQPV
jgi:hypothetical protein